MTGDDRCKWVTYESAVKYLYNCTKRNGRWMQSSYPVPDTNYRYGW